MRTAQRRHDDERKLARRLDKVRAVSRWRGHPRTWEPKELRQLMLGHGFWRCRCEYCTSFDRDRTLAQMAQREVSDYFQGLV